MCADSTLLKPPEAAAVLLVSTRTLEYWRPRGEGPPFVRVGRGVRYRAADLEAWLDAHTDGVAVPS